MPETDSPPKTFLGLCFFLFGFDPVNKTKVKTKLVSGGGVDADQYSANCTHVIVQNIIYDDPVCVCARNDGKTVVTGLWVDHSFDIGMPVDATSIMYRPLRDLNGIPGAKNLIMCLTGYQRQDRDDIMTMVGLMGAQFSKPLVANKITHLICYKFEGEKYELANKMKKIKLVNHRWLEDCLRNWELLPEDNYCKSGYELEMQEAEAKDSEDEAEGTRMKQASSGYANMTPQNSKIGTFMAHEMPKSTEEMQKISHNSTEPEGLSTIVNAKDMLITSGKRSRDDHASSFDNIRVSEVSCRLGAGSFQDATSFELSDPQERTPISTRMTKRLESISKSVERPANSDAKYSDTYYPRRTPLRSPSSIFPGNSGNIRGSPKVLFAESINMSGAKPEYVKNLTKFSSDEIPQQGSDFLHEEALSNKKRKTEGSCSSSKSQEMNHNEQAYAARSPPVTSTIQGLQPTSLVDGSSNNHSPLGNNGYSTHDLISMNAVQNSLTDVSKVKSSSRRNSLAADHASFENVNLEIGENESDKNVAQPFGDWRKNDPIRGNDSGGLVVGRSQQVVAKVGEPQNQKKDGGMSSSDNKRLDGERFDTHAESDVLHVGAANITSKPARKKTASKKTLGSRPKLTSAVSQRGSIHLNVNAADNDPAIGMAEEKEREENRSSSDATELGTSSATVDVIAAEEMETEPARKLGDNTEDKTGFMDDETEAPEEKGECENLLDESKADVTDLSHEANNKMELISEADNSAACMFNGLVEGKNAVEPQKKDESTLTEDLVEGKISRRRKQPLGKTKAKAFSSVQKGESKEVLDMEEDRIGKNAEEKAKATEKERAEPHLATQGKSRIVCRKKSKKAVETEKENDPAVDGDQHASLAEEHVGKTACKSDETLIQCNPKARKSNPASTSINEITKHVKTEPQWFILSGHRLQRKEFQQVIRRLKGKFCRDSHQWSYQATHFIAPDPIRRTEKFFAAAASGRWILKTEYLTACSQAGKFLGEEPYEWYKNGLSEDGAINLESPRKWRRLRERTGHGAFYGMRIIIYGECITPPLDTLKRVVKAGDGTILATSPPYTRFLTCGVDYAIVCPGITRADIWVQEFLKHKIPCIVADYLVEYVCKAGYSLEKHVLYNTNDWAAKSFSNLLRKAEEESVEDLTISNDSGSGDDIACAVCGLHDRGEVMLICCDESGSVGCGVGMHIDCCDPPLESIPEEDWFCSKCRGSRSRSSTSSSPNPIPIPIPIPIPSRANKRKKNSLRLKAH